MTRTWREGGISLVIIIPGGRLASSKAMLRVVSVGSSTPTVDHRATANSKARSLRPLLRRKEPIKSVNPGAFSTLGGFDDIF
jgi:hypothetical protein